MATSSRDGLEAVSEAATAAVSEGRLSSSEASSEGSGGGVSEASNDWGLGTEGSDKRVLSSSVTSAKRLSSHS